MPRTLACPWAEYYRDKSIRCTAGTLQMPSREAWDSYMRLYCASVSGWEQCSLAQEMEREYERRCKNEKKR